MGDGLRDTGRREDAGAADPAAPIDGGCDGRCRSCPVCALLAQFPTVSGFPGRVASSVNRPEVTGHLLAAAGELAAAMSVALGAYAEQAYATTGPGTHATPDEGSTGLRHDATVFQRITVE